MTEDGRYIPPNPSRLAAAARRGVYPRSRALTAGIALSAFAVTAMLCEASLSAGFGALFSHALDAVRHGTMPANGAHFALSRAPAAIIWLAVAPCAGAMAGAYLQALLQRRGQGHTSLPIVQPEVPLGPLAVIRLAGCGLFGLLMLALWRNVFEATEVTGFWQRLARLPATVTGAAGVVLVLVGTGELLIRRAAVFDALRLNRAEARREARAHGDAGKSWRLRQRSGEEARP